MKKCDICGTTEDLQNHHISYEPEIIQVLCVGCHEELHGHGVGKSENCPLFDKLKDDFITLSNNGMIPRTEVAEKLGISYMTAYLWDKKLNIVRDISARMKGVKRKDLHWLDKIILGNKKRKQKRLERDIQKVNDEIAILDREIRDAGK